MSGTHRASPQPRWLFTVDNVSCWLPGTPTFTSAGRIAFEAEIGFLLTFHSWLIASVAGKKLALDGTISAYDQELNEQQRYEFTSASVTSLGFPPLDSMEKSLGFVTLTLIAKRVAATRGSGQAANPVARQLPWRCSDFRLLIDNVNTTKVSHIDAIHVTIPGPLPKVDVLVPAIDIKQFLDWQKSGAPASSKIQLLAADQVTVLLTLSFTSKVSAIAHGKNGSAAGASRVKQSTKGIKVPVALNLMTFGLSRG